MANEEHVWRLLEGVGTWNRWRKTSNEVPNLSGAILNWADLSKANLSRSILREADLSGVVFDRARVGYSTFADVDLSLAKGLDQVKHIGPSTIGIDTIYKSSGKIPEVFLRGAGVPENFITFMSSLVGKPLEFYSCFISYSHADKPFARRLHDALQDRGIRCWLDEHQLLPGDQIFERLAGGIRIWDKFLLCCSTNALRGSWWVDKEIKMALEKEEQLFKARGRQVYALVPLNLDGFMFSEVWDSGYRTEIRSRLATDFTGWEDNNAKFEKQFENVVKALRTDDGGREPPPQPRL